MTSPSERIEMALGALQAAPRGLIAYLNQPGPDVEPASKEELAQAVDLLLSGNPDEPARVRFSNLLRSWDNAKVAPWTGTTSRNTAERRALIHTLLKTDADLKARIDRVLPFFSLEEPIIIADRHTDWYAPAAGVRDYYWSKYRGYLQKKGWPERSIINLDNHTRAVVECLANPEGKEAYSSRGLVMGYVQSGKTANFIGVAAKAADAGYRLIIVLAGTWNILRDQTQRRFDKELLGKELLANDEGYSETPPADWDEFLEHGSNPVELGHFTWQRLTRPDIDFKRLKAAIDMLEYERVNKAAPLYDPANLHSLPVKLLVVKKHAQILKNLAKDLKNLRTKLEHLPVLIIDDESDQAGVNTKDPKKDLPGEKARTQTNLRIVELLRLFPRGQYVGYTATPYANALINPDDPEDLYPKDFILPLDRAEGYMGVSDFFDPKTAYADLDKEDFSLPEIAYIRRVEAEPDEDDEDLKKALRSYVLAGALKLYRQKADPERYLAKNFLHHTMLVHTSPYKGEMATVASRLAQLWDDCAFNSPRGAADLERLWRDDYAKVCDAGGDELTPRKFDELKPSLSGAIQRIERGPKTFLVVNSDSDDAPDFSRSGVWKVLVGGNKLSRGYTVEGLTVSYYRRVAGNADTLMQMGRWFGFRPGYLDLVRVFLGVAEGKSRADLVTLFKNVCLMEEKFREDVKRYIRRPGKERVTPRQVPAMIAATGDIQPTAKNKMFNALVASKNFGGEESMPTMLPAKAKGIEANLKALTQVLGSAKAKGLIELGGTSSKGKRVSSLALVWEAETKGIVSFLEGLRWLETDYPGDERPADIALQIEFLKNQPHGIASWLIVAPQRQVSFGDPLSLKGLDKLAVKERHRDPPDRGFQVFGEPDHRLVARYLVGLKLEADKASLVSPSEVTARLKKPAKGVMVLYPVREDRGGPVSVGHELFFPENALGFEYHFTVRDKAHRNSVVVNRKQRV